MSHMCLEYKKIKGLIFFKTLEIKRLIRKITKKPIFHIIGDSHTLCFQHETFIIHHIGPATAYKLDFEKSTTKSREKVLKIINEIYRDKPINVIFVFGELDVRIHINKISNQKKIGIDKVILETVTRYFNFLNFVKKTYPLINIYVLNVFPQGEEKNIYNYPFYANREKRILIGKKMNKELRDFSNKNNFKFVYVYEQLIDKKGKRIKKFMFDDVHFNRKIMPFVLKSLNNK